MMKYYKSSNWSSRWAYSFTMVGGANDYTFNSQMRPSVCSYFSIENVLITGYKQSAAGVIAFNTSTLLNITYNRLGFLGNTKFLTLTAGTGSYSNTPNLDLCAYYGYRSQIILREEEYVWRYSPDGDLIVGLTLMPGTPFIATDSAIATIYMSGKYYNRTPTVT